MLKFKYICVWKEVAYTGTTYASEFFYNFNPNRKVIKAIAHNFAHFFVSNMNHSSNGLGYVGSYVCEKLAERGENHFFLDILNHKVKLKFFEEDEKFMDDLKRCGKALLEYLFEGYNFPNFQKIVQNATMEMAFDIQNNHLKRYERVNLEAVVKITDENHKVYENHCKNFVIL